jgi:hypothetical protein
LNLYETFEGSDSSSGAIFDLNTTTGYDFSHMLGIDVGIPVYFVVPPQVTKGLSANAAGLGDVYADVRGTFDLGFVNYGATLTGTFPTGNRTKGLSASKTTVDFDSRLDQSWGLFDPFLDIDVGNSQGNSGSAHQRVIRKPYLILGTQATLQAGSELNFGKHVVVSGSGYFIIPWGPQTVISRVVRVVTNKKGVTHNRVFDVQATSAVAASQVADQGFAFSMDYMPNKTLDLLVGYDRSVHYALSTIQFSMTVNISTLLSRSPRL